MASMTWLPSPPLPHPISLPSFLFTWYLILNVPTTPWLYTFLQLSPDFFFFFLIAFFDVLSGIPFLLSLFDWMSPPLEAISDNPPPRWLVLQPWILLYLMPLLPALNYNYLLSEYLLCSISLVLGFLRVRNVTSIFVFPITIPHYHLSLCLLGGYIDCWMVVDWVWGVAE